MVFIYFNFLDSILNLENEARVAYKVILDMNNANTIGRRYELMAREGRSFTGFILINGNYKNVG